ncbi:class B sortase [Gemmiger sp.]|uniref:class B sortase n=1 Tax=Gemmiger sp. TaxID=2049027 RepID=UPI003F0EF369
MAKIRRDPAPYAPARPAPDRMVEPPPEQTAEPGGKHPRSGRIYTIAMIFFAVLFLVSAGMLLKRYLEDRRTENEFASLAALVETQPAAEGSGAAPQQTQTQDPAEKFAALRQRNEDFIGWISIEGTNLDFPVMYRPDSKDFYLRHGFDGEYSNYGVPYLDEDCILTAENRSQNLVIYGHNMKTGTIFGCLTDYKKADTYRKHPVIEFDTLYGDGSYEVFAAFAIDVVEEPDFAYYDAIDLDESAFNAFVAEVKRRSDVDSGITPVYGEDLITLSTCEYSTANGRYVVCARRKTE